MDELVSLCFFHGGLVGISLRDDVGELTNLIVRVFGVTDYYLRVGMVKIVEGFGLIYCSTIEHVRADGNLDNVVIATQVYTMDIIRTVRCFTHSEKTAIHQAMDNDTNETDGKKPSQNSINKSNIKSQFWLF